jgi:hypothetical protein
MLPLYTARFEARDSGYLSSIDEMPGVLGSGASLAAAMASLAACTRESVAFARKGWPANVKRGIKSARTRT